MKYPKKSLGQNFLIDKNIIRKIVNSSKIEGKHIIEIGPGTGNLTDEILKKKPKSLTLIEKDFSLYKYLKEKYKDDKSLIILNEDILKIDFKMIKKKEAIIFGNLPYNISSQILIKFIKYEKWPPWYKHLVFMFQKELGEKIIGKYLTKNYSRLSILTNYRLDVEKKFLISHNCFFPKPKVTSILLHFKPKTKSFFKIKNIDNLETVTNIVFNNKRKMINKKIKMLLDEIKMKKIDNLKLNSRPADLSPETYYKITELFEY